MFLSGPEIKRQLGVGNIVITPFVEEQLNPNSYDVTLDDVLLVFNQSIIDVGEKPEMSRIIISRYGYTLSPGILYLASTREYTESHGFVPILNGKSGIGRLGIQVHQTAGFGDDGFCGKFTLEVMVSNPTRIYAGMRIAQLAWASLYGERSPYKGHYQGQTGVTESRYQLKGSQ